LQARSLDSVRAIGVDEIQYGRGHRFNDFRARKQFSSGLIEGLNNNAKVSMRKAYGFRTFKAIELALDHVLGKLPEPQLTHRFY